MQEKNEMEDSGRGKIIFFRLLRDIAEACLC